MSPAIAAVALAAGYLAGRLRPGRRLFERAYDIATGSDRRSLAWLASVPLVLLGLAVHPVRSIRNVRSWHAAEHREPAPQFDWSDRDPDVCSNCYGTGTDFEDGDCSVCGGTGAVR